jgi:hypothetical protein
VADLWWEGKPDFLICILYLMEISLHLVIPPMLACGSFSSPAGFVKQQQNVWAFGHSLGAGNA